MTFEERYKTLNIQQKLAVDTIEGPVMVIAGPGTGKTTILTMRIANILKRTDTPANGILAITYTSAGVKAMRENLRAIIGSRADEVAIHTFHDFASAMISEYQDHFLPLKDTRLISDVEQESLIREIIADPMFTDLRPAGRPDTYIAAIIRAIDDAKRDAFTSDMVAQFTDDEIERVKTDESSLSTRGKSKGELKAEAKERIAKCEKTRLFALVYGRYEIEKSLRRLTDFNDLIIELVSTLRCDELFLRLLQERFLYLHIDEHQDTNDAQNFIIALIAEFFETPNLFIVGDEKQAIYRFQGASVENFMLLRQRYPAMQIISLEKNYRSHQGILDASFTMIENNYANDEHRDLRIRLTSDKNESGAPITVATGENMPSAETYLVDELRRLQVEDPTASIAIITRRNRELERVLRVLESAGIPVSSERSIDIFKHPVGAVFFDLIEYLADESRTDALLRTAAAGLWSLSFSEIAALSRSVRSGQTVDLESVMPGLRHIARKKSDDDPLGFIIIACRESGFADLCARDPAYVYVWRGIITLAESLIRDRRLINPDDLMRALVDYRRSAESKAIKVSVGAPDLPVKAMTAHGSKGLEFDYVFLPYATEEAWVSRARGSYFVLPKKQVAYDDIRDTRRLFYVALTRARKQVIILTALEESDGSTLTPVRFISELAGDRVSTVRLSRQEAELPKSEDVPEKNGSRALTDLAKHILLTFGLSVTALNHFLEDPTIFLKESILKLPQAPSASAEKGSAMHAAIERVWRLESKTVDAVTDALEKGISEYLNDSFLAAREKDVIKKKLLEDAPAVAKALSAHFATEGTVHAEYWIESIFEGIFGSETIRIPLHGKLDAVIDAGNTVQIFDYKTRQAMSLAEIRGETKNSDGSYLRQLAFYALLAEGKPTWHAKRHETSLVFVTPDDKGRCPIMTISINDREITQLKSEIQSLIDVIWGGILPDSLI